MDFSWPANGIDFEWDLAKAASNYEKHGVTFFEATEVFVDPLAQYDIDEDVEDESRLIIVGVNYSLRLLLAVHTERGKRTRIISARAANIHERRAYEYR